MAGVASPARTHPFVCPRCATRFKKPGTCTLCASVLVPGDEVIPERPRHHAAPSSPWDAVTFAVSATCIVVAVVFAVGTVTLMAVIVTGAVTVGLLVAPLRDPYRPDVGDGLARAVRSTRRDGSLLDGAALTQTAVISSRNPVGCAGLLVGVGLPIVLIRPDEHATVVASALTITGFVVAWVRKVRREQRMVAGRGVPL